MADLLLNLFLGGEAADVLLEFVILEKEFLVPGFAK